MGPCYQNLATIMLADTGYRNFNASDYVHRADEIVQEGKRVWTANIPEYVSNKRSFQDAHQEAYMHLMSIQATRGFLTGFCLMVDPRICLVFLQVQEAS